MGHVISGTVPGTCRISRFPLGCNPLLHLLRHMGTHALFVGFIARMVASDFSLPYILRSASRLNFGGPALSAGQQGDLPRSRQNTYMRPLGSSTPWARPPSHHSDCERVAFDRMESLGDPNNIIFRCSMSLATCTATDASWPPSRTTPHGSRRYVLGSSFITRDFHPLYSAS